MLFAAADSVEVAPGVVLFRGAVESAAEALLSEIEQIVAVSPLRRVMTPMGKPMSVEMTNCGSVGWVSDRTGYRYESIDPVTNQPWPTMPALFADTATEFASLARYPTYVTSIGIHRVAGWVYTKIATRPTSLSQLSQFLLVYRLPSRLAASVVPTQR